ncbi:hypothetical protein IJT10_01540, partial [bacterium]|nr:hypothetical protein [bacterium]
FDVKIWDYTNALTNKNISSALDATNLLLEEDPQRGALTLLSYLNTYLRSIAQINSLLKLYGPNISMISKAIPQKREYQIRHNIEEAKLWSDSQLESAFQEIYKTDYLLKIGQDPLLIIQRLTIQLIQRHNI